MPKEKAMQTDDTKKTIEVDVAAFSQLNDDYMLLTRLDDRMSILHAREMEYTRLLEDVKRELLTLRMTRNERRKKVEKSRDRCFRSVPVREDNE